MKQPPVENSCYSKAHELYTAANLVFLTAHVSLPLTFCAVENEETTQSFERDKLDTSCTIPYQDDGLRSLIISGPPLFIDSYS